MIDIKVLLLLLYNYFGPLLVGLLLMIPMTICRYFKNNYIACKIKNIFFTSIGYILHNFFKIHFYTNSTNKIKEIFENKKQIMVIQNHLSEIDSLFYYSLFDNNKNDYYNSITLMKKGVAYQLLGIGIIDFFGGDVFLSRNIVRDSLNIDNISKYNNAIYLFPEGTTFTKETKMRSDLFCKSQNLPIYDYVLYPRVTGISMIIQNNHIKSMYDLTCMFDNMPKSKFGTSFSAVYFLLRGMPKKVLINVKRYSIDGNKINKQAELIYKYKDKFINNFDSDFEKFNKLKFNFTEGLYSFTIMLLLSTLSIYLYVQFTFIRYLYLIQIIGFLLYLHIIY
jgi:1-acyl-sn-glycerol-3-phosphate acyltransferase